MIAVQALFVDHHNLAQTLHLPGCAEKKVPKEKTFLHAQSRLHWDCTRIKEGFFLFLGTWVCLHYN